MLILNLTCICTRVYIFQFYVYCSSSTGVAIVFVALPRDPNGEVWVFHTFLYMVDGSKYISVWHFLIHRNIYVQKTDWVNIYITERYNKMSCPLCKYDVPVINEFLYQSLKNVHKVPKRVIRSGASSMR